MENKKPIPTPWEVDRTWIRDNNGDTIANCRTCFDKETDEANTEFIVRAVNSHEALLEALKLANQKLIDMGVTNTGWESMNKVWQSIAQAEEGL